MQKKDILLIDDDMSLLVTLGDFLSFEGYNVVTASSGEKGLEKLKSFIPDVIILDMSMPGMGGIGFLDEVSNKAGKPKYPILVLTAKANMAEYFANVEVDGFIAKPCSPEDLLMEVSRIIFLRSGDVAEDLKDILVGSSLKEKRILIVDTDLRFIDKLEKSFASEKAHYTVVKSGPEMLERAVLWEPDIVVASGDIAEIEDIISTLHLMPKGRNMPTVIYNKHRKLTSSFNMKKYVKYVELKNAADVVTEAKSLL